MFNYTTEAFLLNKIDSQHEYAVSLAQHLPICDEIFKACGSAFHRGCGSYLFDGQRYTYDPSSYNKQKLLFDTCRSLPSDAKVLELGTYLGHSALIMLMSNPTLRLTCVDHEARFSLPAVQILKLHFGDRVKFVHKANLSYLKDCKESFDLIHIDAEHESKTVDVEFKLCIPLLQGRSCVVFDDVDSLDGYVEGIAERFSDQLQVSDIVVPDSRYKNTVVRLCKKESIV